MSIKNGPAISKVGGGDCRATVAPNKSAPSRAHDALPVPAAVTPPIDSTSALSASSALSVAETRRESALERIRWLRAAPLSEQEFLDAAIRAVVDALDVPYGKILALEASGPWLTVQAGVGWQPGTVGRARVPLGSRSQAGLALRIGSSVICSDLPRTRRFTDAALLRRHGVVSGMSAVIGTPERPYGVLGVHTTTPRDFTPGETQFVCRAAALVGTGISQRRRECVGPDGAA